MIDIKDLPLDPLDHPARPAAGTPLCAVEELADPGARGFEFRVGERRFFAFVLRRGGAVSGFVNSCPHVGWPLTLDERFLTRDGGYIFCSVHGALFDFAGAGVTSPCLGQHLTVWPVAVRDGQVFTA